MKKLNTYGTISLALAMITGFIFLFQSCDLTSQEEAFKNPYTQQTEQTFNEVSEAVFGNVAENIKGKAYGTVTRGDIMRYANEGYVKWARKNGMELNALNAGFKASKLMQQFRIKNSTNSSRPMQTMTDSLLNQYKLTKKQKIYIKKLPEIVGNFSNTAELQKKLKEFDKKAYKNLGEKDSEMILKMSAAMQVSMVFITTNAKLLGALNDLVMESNEQSSYFHRSNSSVYDGNVFSLIQAQEGPTNPPDARDYFNVYRIAGAAFAGGLGGGSLGLGLGALIGNVAVPGGPGAITGGILGTIIGGVGGTAGGGGFEVFAELKEYSDALDEWCNTSNNFSSGFYDDLCTGKYNHKNDQVDSDSE